MRFQAIVRLPNLATVPRRSPDVIFVLSEEIAVRHWLLRAVVHLLNPSRY